MQLLAVARMKSHAASFALAMVGTAYPSEVAAKECRPKFDAALAQAIAGKDLPGRITLHYSWTGGYGPGDVHLTVKSDGLSRLKLEPNKRLRRQLEGGPDGGEFTASVPVERILAILQSALENRFGCMRTTRRSVCGLDFGKYTLGISVAGKRHDVWLDGSYGVGDYAEEFGALVADIWTLGDVFGVQFDWSAYGSFWSKCSWPTP